MRNPDVPGPSQPRFPHQLRQWSAREFLHSHRNVFAIITLALAYVQPSRRMLIPAGEPASVSFSEDARRATARPLRVCFRPWVSAGDGQNSDESQQTALFLKTIERQNESGTPVHSD